ncbi:hypothetical protein GUJ93_ZPchr0008g11900 [Zizania palustris]|uniref:Uncharacterized protein n=1 Tax=Zizania palustris TaxID=103762 RepID=A0A8J5VHT1_ZIZPA|nr:hypothetical protein GUJ93_ZPchr0008g11900 [Zizania palustris]
MVDDDPPSTQWSADESFVRLDGVEGRLKQSTRDFTKTTATHVLGVVKALYLTIRLDLVQARWLAHYSETDAQRAYAEVKEAGDALTANIEYYPLASPASTECQKYV